MSALPTLLPAAGPHAPSAALDAAVEAVLHDQARLREIHDLGLLSEEVDAILQEDLAELRGRAARAVARIEARRAS